MRILVIGSGGREHAITWKLGQSSRLSELHCTPGNAGICEAAKCHSVDTNDPASIAALAESLKADITMIGPEAPLVAGVREAFAVRKLRIVAPSAHAAWLEGSKVFAKEFMKRSGIPTARFVACDSVMEARAALNQFTFPVVVKANGLAAGKGVRIVNDSTDFEVAIQEMMVQRVFGDSGDRIVIEECLVGDEASLMLFTDGRDYKLLPPARDYKRVDDGDRGPNTGGMGSFSTPGLIDERTLSRIQTEIVAPTLASMDAEGHPFEGILYVGLMLTADGPKVIEYNARLGDPETQAVMIRLESDLVEILDAIIEKRIGETRIEWANDSSVCVVAASKGYPGAFDRGKIITGFQEAGSGEAVVFHAGTARDENGNFVTSGGRVLGVTARAGTLAEARARAYEAVGKLSFEGIHYRKDIAETSR